MQASNPLDMARGDRSAAPGHARQARTPSLLDSLLPVVVMIMLIAHTGPALGFSLVTFLAIGMSADPSADISTDAAVDAVESVFA